MTRPRRRRRASARQARAGLGVAQIQQRQRARAALLGPSVRDDLRALHLDVERDRAGNPGAWATPCASAWRRLLTLSAPFLTTRRWARTTFAPWSSRSRAKSSMSPKSRLMLGTPHAAQATRGRLETECGPVTEVTASQGRVHLTADDMDGRAEQVVSGAVHRDGDDRAREGPVRVAGESLALGKVGGDGRGRDRSRG